MNFQLLETMRWDPGAGFWLLEEHLARMAGSARHFGFPFEGAAARRRLDAAAPDWTGPRRVRLLADRGGKLSTEDAAVDGLAARTPEAAALVWRVAFDKEPVDEADEFLRHKTTRRGVYDAARARHPGCDDVLLVNRRGELTESAWANLVVRRGGAWLTPAAACGLLPGVFRGRLLAEGFLREAVLRPADVAEAGAVYLINSVRGFIRAEIAAARS